MLFIPRPSTYTVALSLALVACDKSKPQAAPAAVDAAAPAASRSTSPVASSVPRVITEMDALRRKSCVDASKDAPTDQQLVSAMSGHIADKMKRNGYGYDLAKLSRPEALVSAVDALQLEVQNGGFDQYFANSAGDDAAYARAGLKEIGDTKSLAIFDRACAPFPAAKPAADRDQRGDQLEAVHKKQGEEWDDKLNDEFGDDETAKARTRLLASYVRAHCAELDAPK